MKCNGKCNGKHNRNAIVLAKILVWPNAVRSWPHEHLCCYTNLTGSVLIELKCVATGRLRLDWSNWAPIQDWQSVGPCRVYALAPIRPIDLGIRILQVRSGISMAGFMLGSVRNRQSMK